MECHKTGIRFSSQQNLFHLYENSNPGRSLEEKLPLDVTREIKRDDYSFIQLRGRILFRPQWDLLFQ